MALRDVVILGAARTPIGRFGGLFLDVHAAELGTLAARAAISRAGISPSDVQDVVKGHGRPAGVGPKSVAPGRASCRRPTHRSGLIMGETAEVLARRYVITREQSDQFALSVSVIPCDDCGGPR